MKELGLNFFPPLQFIPDILFLHVVITRVMS